MAVTTETLAGLRVTFRQEALMAVAAGKNNIWNILGIFGFYPADAKISFGFLTYTNLY